MLIFSLLIKFGIIFVVKINFVEIYYKFTNLRTNYASSHQASAPFSC